MTAATRICVVGLGYVGLPLAVGLAKRFRVVGFDVNTKRIAELRSGLDRNRAIDEGRLRTVSLEYASDPAAIAGYDVDIVTVPTPVDKANRPDLGAVRAACRTVGAALRPGAIGVLESTVYPGVTEDVCGPDIEAA